MAVDDEYVRGKELGSLIESVEYIKKNTDKLLEIVNGNGKDGHTTKIALNRQSIKRLWWAVGIIIAGLSGTCFFVIRNNLT